MPAENAPGDSVPPPGSPGPAPVRAATAEFRGRRCLVTGGLGFIGSNLALRLAEAGARVTVIDALVPRHGGNRRNLDPAATTAPVGDIEVVISDIADTSVVGPIIAGVDYVFDLAGQVSHVDSMDDPLTDFDLNARSRVAFLDLLRRVRPEARSVYASTRQIYGRPRYLPVDEEHPVHPVDVNGISKYTAEQFHILFSQTYGLQTCALRLTNVYGPRQRLRGEHLGFMPVFFSRALEARTINVFGDGSQERDCIYVDDAVDAFLMAVQHPEAVGEVFNIGHHTRHTLADIAHTIVEQAGHGTVEMVPFPRELERIDIGSYHADSSKAKRVLGWSAHTALADGAARTLAYYRDHMAWYL